MIRQGAKLVSSWQDVVAVLPHPIREQILLPLIAQMPPRAEPELEGVEKKVWNLLSAQDAVSIDLLLARLPSDAPEVYSALLSLENLELIRQLPGMKYIRRL